jgi:1-deoxy-D-xylulose-5-phosphate synthase
MRFAKPIDCRLIDKACKEYSIIITIEDGTIVGGFGSAVIEYMQDKDYKNKCIRLGVPDKFIEHATQLEQYEMCGFNTASIVNLIEELWLRNNF